MDYTTLPKGYELPKVFFYQIICSIIILLGTVLFLINTYKEQRISLAKSFYVVSAVSILLSLSALLSPYQEIAIWGNTFRYQGLLTYLLMIWASYVVFKVLNKNLWHLITGAIILSSILQCVAAINQFNNLMKINPELISEGLWINGTFGQANWFAGRILLAIILTAFYFGLKIKTTRNKRILLKMISAILIIFFLTVLGLSQSIWGIISTVVAILLIVLYEILPKKFFAKVIYISIAAGIIAFILYFKLNTEYNLRLDIVNSILIILSQPFNLQQFQFITLGFGFDTLGNVFRDYRLIQGSLVDRAHNVIFDIIIQNGFIILIIFLALVYKLLRALHSNTRDRVWDFTFIAIFAWIFRSIIHENGIVNLMDFLFLFAAGFALLPKQELHRFNSFNTQKVQTFFKSLRNRVS